MFYYADGLVYRSEVDGVHLLGNDSERLGLQNYDGEPSNHAETTQYLHLYLPHVPSGTCGVAGARPIVWLLRCQS